jgi:hypothetical protein
MTVGEGVEKSQSSQVLESPCERRGWHRVTKAGQNAARCLDCQIESTLAWGRAELRKQGDFLENLGNAVIATGNKELRERARFRAAMDKHA